MQPVARPGPVAVSVLLLVFIGLLLFLGLGKQFVPHDPWSTEVRLGVTVTLGALALAIIERRTSILAVRIPTRWVRFAAWPVLAALAAGFIFLPARGFVAALSRVLARDVGTVSVGLISARPTSSVRGPSCKLQVEFKVGRSTERICADGLVQSGIPRQGEVVSLTGPQSSFGIHVSEVRFGR